MKKLDTLLASALLLAACSSDAAEVDEDQCQTIDIDVETELQRLIDEQSIHRFRDVIASEGITLDDAIEARLEEEDIVGLLPEASLPALLPHGSVELPEHLFEPVNSGEIDFQTNFGSWLEAGLFDPSEPEEVEAARAYLIDQMDSDGACESEMQMRGGVAETGDDFDQCDNKDCDKCWDCAATVKLFATAKKKATNWNDKRHVCDFFEGDTWRWAFDGSKADWFATGGWAKSLPVPVPARFRTCKRVADTKQTGVDEVHAFARARYHGACPEDLKVRGTLYPEAAHSAELRATASEGGGGTQILDSRPWYAEAKGGAKCSVSGGVVAGVDAEVTHAPDCTEEKQGGLTAGWSKEKGYYGGASIQVSTRCRKNLGIPTNATIQCLISHGPDLEFCGRRSKSAWASIGGFAFGARATSVDNHNAGGWFPVGAKATASAKTVGGRAKINLGTCQANYPCIPCKPAGDVSAVGPSY